MEMASLINYIEMTPKKQYFVIQSESSMFDSIQSKINLLNSGEVKISDDGIAAMTTINAHGKAPGSENPPTVP